MSGRACLAALALGLLLAPGAAAQKRDPPPRARSSEKLEAKVVVDDTWPPVGPGLVFPVRVSVENLGDAREFEVEWTGNRTNDRVARRFRLEEGELVRFTLLVPRAGTHYGSRLVVRADGREDPDLLDESNWLGLDTSPKLSPGRVRGRGVLVVDDQRPDLRALEARDPSDDTFRQLFVLSPGRLSEKWQAYDGLRMILVRAPVWSSLAPEHARAIETAVRAGGTILFYGEFEEDTAPEGPRGLGTVRRVKGDPFAEKSLGWLDWTDPWVGKTLAPKTLRIPGVDAVPLLALKVILLVFVLLVGPGNLLFTWYVLKKRALLLLTTPALAAFGSLLLFAWSFASEGFGVRSTTVSWTWLDPDSNTAVVRQESGLYAGLAPSDGLVLDPDTAVWTGNWDELHRNASPSWSGAGPGSAYGEDESDAAYDVDWSAGLAIRAGGLPARRMTWMSSGRVLEVRSRISVEEGTLVNGLGVPILVAWIPRKEGDYLVYDGAPLEPGGRGRLESRRDLDLGRASRIPSWLAARARYGGEYLLVVESNPWLELGIEDPDAKEDLHVVTGRLVLP